MPHLRANDAAVLQPVRGVQGVHEAGVRGRVIKKGRDEFFHILREAERGLRTCVEVLPGDGVEQPVLAAGAPFRGARDLSDINLIKRQT